MERPKWKAGSFDDNFHHALVAVGLDNAPLAYGLALVNWTTPDDRDEFLRAFTNLEGS